jgi:tetratricopeptide (TPR) repeat protein
MMNKPKRLRPAPEDARARSILSTFEVGLSRAVLESNPQDVRALEMLGQALTRAGRHDEALEADLRLAGLRPKDPVAFYNLACSYSHLENLDAAFDALHRAFDLGYRDYRHLLRDPDLENVRKDRRFKRLLDKKWGKRQP